MDSFDPSTLDAPAPDDAPVSALTGMGGAPAGPDDGRDRELEQKLLRWADTRTTINICFDILKNDPNGETLLGDIGQRVVREYEIDEASRVKWLEENEAALNLALQVADKKSTPWPNASNIIYPLLSSTALQFAARAYPAIVPAPDVVKGVVVGDDKGEPEIDPKTGQQAIDPQTKKPVWKKDPKTGQPMMPGMRRQRADRIGEHMSWQYIEEQPEWEEETDKLLSMLPIAGCVFRKTFHDVVHEQNCSLLVTARDLVINYKARSLASCPRITEIQEIYPNEILELEAADVFVQYNYGPSEGPNAEDTDSPRVFLEQHRLLDLDKDGYAEPYVVTVHKMTSKVVRIVARYDAEGIHFRKKKNGQLDTRRVAKIDPVHYYTKYDFLPNPDGGIYGVGFGKLLGPINESINTALNQMFDAENLKITGGGFIGKGFSMSAGSTRFKLAEWKFINAPGGTIRDAIVPLQHPGASTTMFQLLGFLVQAGKELGAHAEVLTGNQSRGNVPASTTMALIEQGLKVYTAIYKRVYRAAKSEFHKQYRLNRLFLTDDAHYQRNNEWKQISREDYALGSGVIPISDPSMTTEMQKLVRAEFLKPFLNDPFCQPIPLRQRIFAAANIDKPEELIREQPIPNAQFVLKQAEIAVKMLHAKGQAMMEYGKAVESMANAELAIAKAGGEKAKVYLAFMEQELKKFELMINAIGQNDQGQLPQFPGTTPPPGMGGGNVGPPGAVPGANGPGVP